MALCLHTSNLLDTHTEVGGVHMDGHSPTVSRGARVQGPREAVPTHSFVGPSPVHIPGRG